MGSPTPRAPAPLRQMTGGAAPGHPSPDPPAEAERRPAELPVGLVDHRPTERGSGRGSSPRPPAGRDVAGVAHRTPNAAYRGVHKGFGGSERAPGARPENH